MANKNKKPYTPQQRQEFVDSLQAQQRNNDPKQVFKRLISRAAQPTQEKAQDKDAKS